jgi:hypothetical protein
MSHNVLIQNVKITSLDALRRAVTELQGEGINVALLDKQTFRTYRGQSNKCDMCISLPGENHDVGMRLNQNGYYDLIYDPYGMHKDGTGVSCEFRQGDVYDYSRIAIGKLLQRYSTCVTEDTFATQGFPTVRELDAESGDVFVIAETF